MRIFLPLAVVAVAVSVFVGVQYGGHSNASGVSWYFWDGGYVHIYPDKYEAYSRVDSYANGGTTHTVSAQVHCVHSDGSDYNGATVHDGSYYNNWWGYLPYKYGWVNEVHFGGGGNDQNAIPINWVYNLSPGSANCGF